jgi:hypothetical protein
MEIERELRAVTDAQVKRAEQKLAKLDDKDKSLGVLTSLLAKRLYVVAGRLYTRLVETYVRMRNAESDEEEEAARQEGYRYNNLEDYCREMMWIEVRAEIGHWNGNIGLREAWMIVESTPEQDLGDRLASALRSITEPREESE